ncbi:MAG: nucleotidyltransferase [candidate division WOR-3 bacterium]|nr:MAG: nucleotidyltransferase [candidate division WOR-3 bacterium]
MINIESILKKLEEYKVNYAVIGGVAVVLYGYVRFTKDIDLLIDFSSENVKRFADVLNALNFRSGAPVDIMELADPDKRKYWMEEKNARVITFYNPDIPFLQIDVLITRNLGDLKKTRRKIGDFEVSVVDYDDLLKMKKETARPTDLIDIEKLEELKELSE